MDDENEWRAVLLAHIETLKPGTWGWAKAKAFLGKTLVRISWERDYGYEYVMTNSIYGEMKKICLDPRWRGQVVYERTFLTVEEQEATDWIVISEPAIGRETLDTPATVE